MTIKELLGIAEDKMFGIRISAANAHIFQYLMDLNFNVEETKTLISSMEETLNTITKPDPMKKLSEFVEPATLPWGSQNEQDLSNELDELKKILANNQAHIPEDELRTKYKRPYEELLEKIARLDRLLEGSDRDAAS